MRKRRPERTVAPFDRRAVSDVVGYVLVFSLVSLTVGVVSVAGVGALQDARDVEQANNAERAFDVLGDNVEGRLGWHRFLVFYLVCGLFAGALHVAGHPNSQIPAVGASGAISGILGAYLVFFPHNRLLLRYLWRWGFWVHPVRWEVPAWAYLGFWILMQVLFATLNVPGVAWYAHVGGFISGVGVALGARLLRREPAEERDWELTG